MVWAHPRAATIGVLTVAMAPLFGQTGLAANSAEPASYRLRMLDACVNGVCDKRVARLLETGDGELLVTRRTLADWGFATPGSVAARRNGQPYYALDRLADVSYNIDEAKQRLLLETGAPDVFLPGERDYGGTDFTPPTDPSPGGFLNYDIVHETTADEATSNAAIDMGFFNGLGTGTTTVLARDFRSDADYVRLNTTWRRDWPADVRTLSMGDAISRPGSWGRAVQFGGVQWGSNFDTRPDFVTFPLPRIDGETTVPASVELYANDQARVQQEIDAGPFSLHNIPVTTGANDLRIVVTDVLGRERVITRPFYASNTLLKRGLHDFSYEVGAVREGFAIRSNDYGRAFAAGTHRLGITADLTGEVRAELLADQATAGIGGSWLLHPRLGVVSTAVAGSTGDAGGGSLLAAGLNRVGRRFSYGAEGTWTTPGFRQLGLQPGRPAPARTLSAHVGARLVAGISAAVNYTALDRRDFSDNRFVTGTLSTRLPGRASLHTSLLRDLEQHDNRISLTLSLPLGDRRSANLTHVDRPASHGTRVQLQRNAARGTGFGYQLSAEDNSKGDDRYRLSTVARAPVGSYRAEAVRSGDERAYRLSAQGGVGVLAGRAFLSRTIDGGFGVVRVGNYPDVRVYHENQLIDRTDERGMAFIPDLRAFEKNRIRIAADDLPLDTRIAKLASVAVPGFRQGLLVDVEAQPNQGALVTLHREDGRPLPAGARVRIVDARVDTQKWFPVARRGQAWITGLPAETTLEARWNGQRCTARIRLPGTPGPMPRIGPVTCRTVP